MSLSGSGSTTVTWCSSNKKLSTRFLHIPEPGPNYETCPLQVVSHPASAVIQPPRSSYECDQAGPLQVEKGCQHATFRIFQSPRQNHGGCGTLDQ